jgi:hypothetical protein
MGEMPEYFKDKNNADHTGAINLRIEAHQEAGRDQ